MAKLLINSLSRRSASLKFSRIFSGMLDSWIEFPMSVLIFNAMVWGSPGTGFLNGSGIFDQSLENLTDFYSRGLYVAQCLPGDDQTLLLIHSSKAR